MDKINKSAFGFFKILLGVFFATSCTTPTEKLDPEANHVIILKNPTLSELEKLKKDEEEETQPSNRKKVKKSKK